MGIDAEKFYELKMELDKLKDEKIKISIKICKIVEKLNQFFEVGDKVKINHCSDVNGKLGKVVETDGTYIRVIIDGIDGSYCFDWESLELVERHKTNKS